MISIFVEMSKKWARNEQEMCVLWGNEQEMCVFCRNEVEIISNSKYVKKL